MKSIAVLKAGKGGRVTLREATKAARRVKAGRTAGELTWEKGDNAGKLRETYLGKIVMISRGHATNVHHSKATASLVRSVSSAHGTVVGKSAAKKK